MKNPWYVTGLTDGEGCFSVSFNFRHKLKNGIEVRPSFSLTLNKQDLDLIKDAHNYFQVGGIRYSKADRCYKFEVRRINDLQKKIIPHFEKYPLQGKKSNDFQLFKMICALIYANQHLSREVMIKIVIAAYQMNPSGKRKIPQEKLLNQLAS